MARNLPNLTGRPGGLRGVAWAAAGAVLLALGAPLVVATAPLWGCVRNIPGDSNTGKDGKVKGAKPIRIEDGEGRVRDTVTYPGGDRVDWKMFEIPDGPGGKMRVKMRIRPPRRGHTVAFALYDETYHRIDRTTKRPRSVKSITVDRARPGKYYLQIFAPERKDAGDYIVSVRYKEREPESSDPCKAKPELPQCDEDLPDPVTLPAIPEPDCRRDEDCKDGATCQDNKCVAKDPCANMTCPEGQSCQVQGTQGVCTPDEVEVECVTARLVKFQVTSSGSVIITLDQGKAAGVGQGWNGQVLLRSSGRPLEGGEFKVTKVTQRESIGKVRLSLDQLSANRRMKLCPE